MVIHSLSWQVEFLHSLDSRKEERRLSAFDPWHDAKTITDIETAGRGAESTGLEHAEWCREEA